MKEELNNNEKEEESYTKTSNNVESQIENIKKEFDFQNKKKKSRT